MMQHGMPQTAMQSIVPTAGRASHDASSFDENAPTHARSALRVGTDIVAVAEVAESIAKFGDKYVARVFTPAEIAYCASRGESAPLHYAARFAAKEAAMKVLRPGKDDALDWQSIEVIRGPRGACEIVLRGLAAMLARDAGITSLAVSLSHEASHAVAVVIGTGVIGTGVIGTGVIGTRVMRAGAARSRYACHPSVRSRIATR